MALGSSQMKDKSRSSCPSRLSLRRLWRDRTGVSAIEFAFIFPVMIVVYMGAVDLSQVLTADRKVTNLASSTADLVAQAEVVNAGALQDIFDAAAWIMEPFSTAGLSIVVTSVVLDKDGNPEVAWSEAYNGSKRAKGSSVSLPDNLIETGGSVIMAEVRYQYTSVLSKFVSDGFTLSDTFYLRPRRVQKIEFVQG